MLRVAVYAFSELRQDAQLRLITASMDVKALQVVWRALPPVIAMISNVVFVADDRALSILYASRAVKVVAIEPSPRAIEHLARPQLVLAYSSCDRMIEFQICSHSGQEKGQMQ